VEAPKDTMMATLLTINDKLPYTELKKIIEVEGEKNQTAEEINVGALLFQTEGSFTTQRFAEGLTWLVFTGQVRMQHCISCATAAPPAQECCLPWVKEHV